ncbi:hypothetical protein A7U43_03085 [Mycobacterium adipatum]|uniref:Uncharacterized protein n=2 Tax=Mycobacterium adipatum TaxID=1682113 RepID=A0A172UHB0_9MYCO|nr:hypothetical protein A7U43_03085 [Mycobacterium adipatum]
MSAMTNADDVPLQVSLDELGPGVGGSWLVVTQGSRHEWDLDAMTYMRMPGPASLSGQFAMDGQRLRITRVERWPRVGFTSLVFFDDPTRPLDYEHFRQSSQIESITQITTTDSASPPRSPTGYMLLDSLVDENPTRDS